MAIDLETLKKKMEELKQKGTVDLSTEEDLSLAIMNLVSLEEHFFFTGRKTGKPEYNAFLSQVREIRKELLGRMIDRHEGETWCAAKHLLAASMRLMEVGTKLQGDGKKEDAEQMFARSYELYSMFWGIRLKLLDLPALKEEAAQKPWNLEDIVEKMVNCCDE